MFSCASRPHRRRRRRRAGAIRAHGSRGSPSSTPSAQGGRAGTSPRNLRLPAEVVGGGGNLAYSHLSLRRLAD